MSDDLAQAYKAYWAARTREDERAAYLEILRLGGKDGYAMAEDIKKRCITCDGEGHTYMECPRVPFGILAAGAMGASVPDREQYEAELRKIEAERKLTELDEHAGRVASLIEADDGSFFASEILRLDDTSRAIVVEVCGVDYVLTMTRAPKQRVRPLVI